MTPEELAIHGKLKSRRWRLNNLYWIEDKKGRKRKFRMNWAQEAFFVALWWLNVILKARQLGMSTFMAIFILDTCLFSKSKTCGIIDKTDKDATKKLGKIKFAYDNLDSADPCEGPSTADLGAMIKAVVSLLRDNDHELEFSNDSKVWAGTSLRGGTLQILHISELGYIAAFNHKKAEEIRSGALNTVDMGCLIVIESTHEGGKVGLNYEMIALAQEAEKPLGLLDWQFHFFGWHQDPNYTVPDPRPVIDPKMIEYFAKLQEEHGILLTPGQKAWYAGKAKTQKEAMKKEYPSTPEEAVNAVVKGAIYGEWMSRARAQGRITTFNLMPGYPVYTAWDIGVSDFTSIWFIQPFAAQDRVFSFYENNGMSIAHYVEVLRAFERDYGIVIAGHLLPHDAGNRQIGASGEGNVALSPIQQLDAMGVKNCFRVPRIPDEWDGINRTRDMMENMLFHVENCGQERVKDGRRFPSGIGALEGFRVISKESDAVLREKPLHDECSHGAAALRTYAEGSAAGMVARGFSGTGPETGGSAPKVRVKMGVGSSSGDDWDDDEPKARVWVKR